MIRRLFGRPILTGRWKLDPKTTMLKVDRANEDNSKGRCDAHKSQFQCVVKKPKTKDKRYLIR